LPVILVNKVVDPKRIIRQIWSAKEEERHKGLLTKKMNIDEIYTLYAFSLIKDNSDPITMHIVYSYPNLHSLTYEHKIVHGPPLKYEKYVKV
jgi:hypothetical protein